jgi:cation diffusion facilitator CzcD-associated flavoprotein CzcO
MKIVGRGGVDVRDWVRKSGFESYRGMMFPGAPNSFSLLGPNSVRRRAPPGAAAARGPLTVAALGPGHGPHQRARHDRGAHGARLAGVAQASW